MGFAEDTGSISRVLSEALPLPDDYLSGTLVTECLERRSTPRRWARPCTEVRI